MCSFCWTGLMTSFDWDCAASLAYDSLGLCPRSRSMIPFPWASQLVGQPGQRTRDSVPGVLELRVWGRTLVLAQGNSGLAASVKYLFLLKKKSGNKYLLVQTSLLHRKSLLWNPFKYIPEKAPSVSAKWKLNNQKCIYDQLFQNLPQTGQDVPVSRD